MRAIASVLGCLLGVAACSSGYGANVTFSAPKGPSGAASYEIVLATTDLAPIIPAQRVSPTGSAEEAVTYYFQRTAIAGGRIDQVDGFHVLVEDVPGVSEAAYVPFALFYDDAKHLVGIGTYAIDGAPAPVVVPRARVGLYTLEVEPVAEVVDAMPVVASEALRVECRAGDTSFVSGIVWRAASGHEVRVMLPDPGALAADPLDATLRPLDLDCDGVAVAVAASSNDCDDTRARFHAGAADVCDGEDTNCDGARYVVQPCHAASGCAASTGVELCAEATRETYGCTTDNTCACEPDSTSSTCRRCTIQAANTLAGEHLCLPAVDAMIGTQGTCSAGCTIAVVATHGGWTAQVAPTAQGPFGATAIGVTSSYALRVTRPDTGVANPAMPVGSVDLAYVTTTGPVLASYELEAASTGIGACAGTGPYVMNCVP
jgi:hypothetical protein